MNRLPLIVAVFVCLLGVVALETKSAPNVPVSMPRMVSSRPAYLRPQTVYTAAEHVVMDQPLYATNTEHRVQLETLGVRRGDVWNGRGTSLAARYPHRVYYGPRGGEYVVGQPVRNFGRLWLRVAPLRRLARGIGLFFCGLCR